MTARSLHEIATGKISKMRRTGQPVRRNSYNVGEREGRIWKPVARREIGPRLRAAEAYNREHKKPGAPNGPLGHVGLEVLRELYRIVCYRTGRLDPSLDFLMRKLRRSRAAIVRGLAALKEHGFIDWIRRTEPTENAGREGPQVRQVSNAYFFKLPAKALALVQRIVGRAPPPDDEAHRNQSERELVEEMIQSLPLDEHGTARVCDPGLAAALDRLGGSVDQRARSASSPGGQNPGREG